MAQQVFVGYDDIADYIWDILPPGEEFDYNVTLIVEEVIDTWPALIGWHAEVSKGAAIQSVFNEDQLAEIIQRNPA